MAWGLGITIGLLFGIIIGAFIGFILTKRGVQKQLEKNPPVSEKMIRTMFSQMGRKASESQIEAVMKSMNKNK